MHFLNRYMIGFCLLVLASLTAFADPTLLGGVENGLLGEQCIPMKIKLDTGAKTSSVSAHDIQFFEKERVKWVRFTLDPDRTPTEYRLELPLERMVKIRKRTAEMTTAQTYEERPIVKMALTMGQHTHDIEVSLANRSHFTYGMLLGRSAMDQFQVIIDPGASFTQKPSCPNEKKRDN